MDSVLTPPYTQFGTRISAVIRKRRIEVRHNSIVSLQITSFWRFKTHNQGYGKSTHLSSKYFLHFTVKVCFYNCLKNMFNLLNRAVPSSHWKLSFPMLFKYPFSLQSFLTIHLEKHLPPVKLHVSEDQDKAGHFHMKRWRQRSRRKRYKMLYPSARVAMGINCTSASSALIGCRGFNLASKRVPLIGCF